MKKIFTLFLFMVVLVPAMQAQSWQWAKRLGGAHLPRWNHFLASSGVGEDILDMATDPNGNVYLLYTDYDSSINIDGRPVPGYGTNDIILSSFSCDGVYRWSKVLGTRGDTDRGVAVRTDVHGGVYVCGILPWLVNDTGHMGTDTAIVSAGRSAFLAKWDTSGKFQWLRMPEPDTMSRVGSMHQHGIIDMDVDAQQGNCYLLAYLRPGIYGGSYTVATAGMYVLTYGIAGNFVSGIPLPFHYRNGATGYSLITRLTCNTARDRLIVSGFNLGYIDSIGSVPVPNGAYVATFNMYTGAAGFVKTSNGYGAIIPGRVKTDAQDHIYVGGITRDAGAFNGVAFSNLPAFPQNRGGAFIMKMDAATGNPLWTQMARTSVYGDAQGSAISVSGQKVLFGGSFRDSVIFPTDSFSNNYLVNGEDCFAMQLDAATGAIQHIRTFGGPGTDNYAGISDAVYAIEADRRGNFYICGIFDGKPFAIGKDSLHSAGSSDAFVTKWGYANCNCSIPKASFTSLPPVGNSVRYNYTGTFIGIDSLVWEWGDGTKQKLTSGYLTRIAHTFPSSGHYTVCVTAYTANCGTSTACNRQPLSVPGMGLQNVTAYPNPARGEIFIDGLEGGQAELLTFAGQRVLTAAVRSARQAIDIEGLPAGIYMLVMTDANGARGVMKIVKR